MSVRINRVYTKVGDKGTTALGDGTKVAKTSPRLAAYADVDEANAAIGLVLAVGQPTDDVAAVLKAVQNDMFDVGADLCTPIVENPPYEPLRITEAYVERLEGWIDEFNERLPKLTSFILPGGTAAAAFLHQARTVTRRAERGAWALVEVEPETTNTLAAKYLNRLSDLLFVLCRVANPDGDVLWTPGAGRG
jgi:cob(I)alamin adenosyltransferase